MGFSEGTPEQVLRMKTAEVTHARLAMLGFSGMVTQARARAACARVQHASERSHAHTRAFAPRSFQRLRVSASACARVHGKRAPLMDVCQ